MKRSDMEKYPHMPYPVFTSLLSPNMEMDMEISMTTKAMSARRAVILENAPVEPRRILFSRRGIIPNMQPTPVEMKARNRVTT